VVVELVQVVAQEQQHKVQRVVQEAQVTQIMVQAVVVAQAQ
jgi:hypothetical protein